MYNGICSGFAEETTHLKCWCEARCCVLKSLENGVNNAKGYMHIDVIIYTSLLLCTYNQTCSIWAWFKWKQS